MLTEKSIENKIKRLLASRGAYFFKHFGCNFSTAGVPDLICCVNGRFIAIEVKAPNGRLSEIQKIHIQRIIEAGGIAIVAQSVEEVEHCLNYLIIN